MNTPQLLFFTYANKEYDLFALPYAFFALQANPNSIVEIILEDALGFHQEYKNGIARLNSIFPDRAIFRQSKLIKDGFKSTPHVVRFIEEPTSIANYVYIGDIDIIIFDNIYDKHKAFIDKHNLPFSNIIRSGTEDSKYPRLTGLHFCEMTTMYPLPDISDLDVVSRNDENVLYEIMNRKNTMVPRSFRNRPACGIHISLNRDAVGRYIVNLGHQFLVGDTFHWGISPYKKLFLDMLKNPHFSEIYLNFSMQFRALLMVIEATAKDELRSLNRLSSDFLVDKRITTTIKSGKRNELIAKAENLLTTNKQSMDLLHNVINIWPNNFDSYIPLARIYFKLGNNCIATELLLHAKDLSSSHHEESMLYNLVDENRSLITNDELLNWAI